jgi:hypothetical protein
MTNTTGKAAFARFELWLAAVETHACTLSGGIFNFSAVKIGLADYFSAGSTVPETARILVQRACIEARRLGENLGLDS